MTMREKKNPDEKEVSLRMVSLSNDGSDWILQVARPERDCPGGSERLAIVTLSPDTLR